MLQFPIKESTQVAGRELGSRINRTVLMRHTEPQRNLLWLLTVSWSSFLNSRASLVGTRASPGRRSRGRPSPGRGATEGLSGRTGKEWPPLEGKWDQKLPQQPLPGSRGHRAAGARLPGPRLALEGSAGHSALPRGGRPGVRGFVPSALRLAVCLPGRGLKVDLLSQQAFFSLFSPQSQTFSR